MEGKNTFSETALIDEPQAGREDDLFVADFDERKDYFIERNGEKFAGTHLIVDCIGAENLDSLEAVEACMRRAVVAADATLLHIHLHHFTPNGGISGVAVLAESHISIHSWPEHGYAAMDVFMCGDAKPHKTLDVIQAAFEPEELRVEELLRGKGALQWRDGLKKHSI